MFKNLKATYIGKPNEDYLGNHNLTTVLSIFWISAPLIKLMKKSRLKVNPNFLTLMSISPILGASYFFLKDELLIGALLFFIFLILDDMDGMWARLTKKTSKLGHKLDSGVAILGTFLMYCGLWYSQYYLEDNWIIGGAIIFSHYAIMIAFQIFVYNRNYKTILPRVNSYYSPRDEKFGTFFIAPLLNSVNILLPALVMLQFASFIILFLKQKERPVIYERIKEIMSGT